MKVKAILVISIYLSLTISIVPSAAGGEFSKNDKDRILRLHNDKRAKALIGGRSPGNMMKMVWDSELETRAEKDAKQCNSDRSNSRNDHDKHSEYDIVPGTNVADSYEINDALEQWWDKQIDNFVWDRDNIQTGAKNLVQMALWNAAKLGCARHYCGKHNGKEKHRIVCKYINNIHYKNLRKSPYLSGQNGLLCDKYYQSFEGLCDCKGRFCANGGMLDVRSCECYCRSGFQGHECLKKHDDKVPEVSVNGSDDDGRSCRMGDECILSRSSCKNFARKLFSDSDCEKTKDEPSCTAMSCTSQCSSDRGIKRCPHFCGYCKKIEDYMQKYYKWVERISMN